MAVDCDGVDDVLECALESGLDWDRLVPHSQGGWLRTPVIEDGGWLGKGDTALFRGFVFNVKSASGPRVHAHLVNASLNEIEVITDAASFAQFLWVRWDYTYSGSGAGAGVKIFRNGAQVTGTVIQDTLTGTILNDKPFRVGGVDGSEFVNVDVAGAVADNVEWTASEVAALAKLANRLKPPSQLLSAAPELWLPISARPGASSFDLKDYSGNGHDASIVGAPVAVADPEVVIDWKANHSGFTDFPFTVTASTTHSPHVAALQGVLVLIHQNVSSADLISSVTYGGMAMRRVATDADAVGEQGRVYAYLLEGAVPSGDQTVTITVSSGTDAKTAWIVGLLAPGDVEVAAVGTTSGDQANPSITLATAPNFSGLVASVIHSGQNAPASVTPGTGYTGISGAQARDYGTQVARVMFANKEGANVIANWTQAIEDCAMIALAIRAKGRRSDFVRSDAVHRASRW